MLSVRKACSVTVLYLKKYPLSVAIVFASCVDLSLKKMHIAPARALLNVMS